MERVPPAPLLDTSSPAPDAPLSADTAPPPRRRSRLPWILAGCGIVLLLVIATPGVIYFRAAGRCARYTPTGDALFDHYAQAVIERQAPRLFIRSAGNPNIVLLPDAVLASWEEQFGNDPRYWQLRFLCTADLADEAAGGPDAGGPVPGTEFLEQARERGVADFDTLYELWRQYYRRWAREREQEQADPAYLSNSDDPVRYERAMIERHGPEMRALLDEMVAASPDESFPYYRRARFHFIQGEYDQALADLKAGNAAPVNRLPGVFPVSFVRRGLSAGRELDNEFLAGGILGYGMAFDLENYRAWKEFGRGIQRLAVPNQREWSNEYHRFACRFGLMDGAGWIDRLVASVMVRIVVEDYLVNRPAELSVAERKALFELAVAATRVSGEQHKQSALQSIVGESEQLSVLQQLAGSLIESDAQSMRFDYNYIAGEYRDLEGGYRRVLERLAEFDYNTMTWPEDGVRAPAP